MLRPGKEAYNYIHIVWMSHLIKGSKEEFLLTNFSLKMTDVFFRAHVFQQIMPHITKYIFQKTFALKKTSVIFVKKLVIKTSTCCLLSYDLSTMIPRILILQLYTYYSYIYIYIYIVNVA